MRLFDMSSAHVFLDWFHPLIFTRPPARVLKYIDSVRHFLRWRPYRGTDSLSHTSFMPDTWTAFNRDATRSLSLKNPETIKISLKSAYIWAKTQQNGLKINKSEEIWAQKCPEIRQFPEKGHLWFKCWMIKRWTIAI